MGYGIILTFDSSIEQKVRRVWTAIEQAQIGKTPGQYGEPPHVGFSDMPTGDPQKLWEAARSTPFTDLGIRLLPYGVFSGKEHTVYFKAILSRGLNLAHLAHYRLLQLGGINFNPLYSPEKVIFHCTIAVDVQESRLKELIALLAGVCESIDGSVAALEMWGYFPARRLERIELTSGATKRKDHQ